MCHVLQKHGFVLRDGPTRDERKSGAIVMVVEDREHEPTVQVEYDNSMKDSNKVITKYVGGNAKKGFEVRVIAKFLVSMGRKDFGQTLEELEDLNGVIGVERRSCDCVLRKLEARQAARVAEINSLSRPRIARARIKSLS
jgi:hypothetical protein